MNEQPELLTTQPAKNPGDSNSPVSMLVNQLESGQLQIPEFQRGFVWDVHQIKGWTKSIIDQNAIGVIVTYQLPSGGPFFLADGLQRITATTKFIEDPYQYGYDFGTEQAIQYCEAFAVPIQHRIYQGHEKALEAFQYLNKGTALSVREFYAGTLRLMGPLGRLADKELTATVSKVTSYLVLARSRNRKQKQMLERDSFCLFYQYATVSKNKSFWTPNTTRLHKKGPIIEELLKSYIEKKTERELRKEIKQFEKFLREQLAQIETLSNKGRVFASPCLHAFIHACIYRKNVKIPTGKFWSLIELIFKEWRPQKSYSTRLVLPARSDDGPPFDTTIQVHTVNWLDRCADHFDVDLYAGRKKGGGGRSGWEKSHVDPVATHGEGPTILEPAPANRARGAESIE